LILALSGGVIAFSATGCRPSPDKQAVPPPSPASGPAPVVDVTVSSQPAPTTLQEREPNELVAAEEEKPAAKPPAEAATSAPAIPVVEAPEQAPAARLEAFNRYREEGIAAFERKDYPKAIAAFSNALKERDDPEVRVMLEQATEKTRKPTLAVPELSVSGNVGIPDAGKSVAELLLTKFDPQRFQLIERTQLAAILKERDLALAQVTENPEILRLKKLQGVRYLVVGQVARLGNLSVSARLVDAATGDIVQTAEVSAENPRELHDVLGELAYMLQLGNDEKAAYLEERRRQMAALAEADAAAKASAQAQMRARLERERQKQKYEQFQARQRLRDAQVAMADIKALMARGDYESARRLARFAVREFADTPLARELGDLQAAAESGLTAARDAEARRSAQERARIESERRLRLERFQRCRDQALAATSRYDYATAIELLRSALKEQDDPDARALLVRLVEQTSAPALAVLDFEVTGDLGLEDAGRSIAAYLLTRMGTEQRRCRTVNRQALMAMLNQANLTPAQLAADPFSPVARRLRGIRYLVTGKAVRTHRIFLSARLVDLAAGHVVQTAELSPRSVNELQPAVAELAGVLQMTDSQKRAYQDRAAEENRRRDAETRHDAERTRKLQYERAIGTAREAISKGNYRIASEAIAAAQAIDPDGREAKDLFETLGPVLTVTADVAGAPYAGAQITINGQLMRHTTPATFRLNKGKTYEVGVAIPQPSPDVRYTKDTRTFRADKSGPMSFNASLRRLRRKEAAPTTSAPPIRTDSRPAPGPTPVPAPFVRPKPPARATSALGARPSTLESDAATGSRANRLQQPDDRRNPSLPSSDGGKKDSRAGDLRLSTQPVLRVRTKPTTRVQAVLSGGPQTPPRPGALATSTSRVQSTARPDAATSKPARSIRSDAKPRSQPSVRVAPPPGSISTAPRATSSGPKSTTQQVR
jgi:curli biogenesis system outer membrane secretion channel CsgG